MDLRQRRELHNGFGESLSRAFELALTPAIFGFLGYLLDGWLGTRPLFMLVFFAFVITYLIWKQFRQYDADMREQENRLFGPRDRGSDG
jgi:F0F1-type ATP synthase assembly protein I